MWDIFNKEKIIDLTEEVNRRDSELEKSIRTLQSLESELMAIKDEKERLVEQSEIQKQSIDVILKEFKEFIIQNRKKGLNFDNLNSTRGLINDIADLHEYTVDLHILLTSSSLRAFRSRFVNMLELLKEESLISSYSIEIDHLAILNRRSEEYKAIVVLYSNQQARTIENILLDFLYRRRIVIHVKNIQNGKIITVKGSIKESIF